MKKYLALNSKNASEKIDTRSICFIQQQARKVEILTVEGRRIMTYGSVLEYAQNLGESFIPVKKYTLVNYDLVKKMEDCCIVFVNDECLWMGKNNFILARKKYNDYLEKNLALKRDL